MLNGIWLGLVLVAVLTGAVTGELKAVSTAAFESAEAAVMLVIQLAGFMMFMLGAMRVARDAGLVDAMARALAPLLRRLFPEVPPDHPAMGAMIMNMASNIFGMGNAATPFGLKAMAELNRLNPHRGVATDPMVLFLAINTSAITLMLPTGTIAVRAAAGSAAPGAIWIPTLIATTCSTLAAISAYYVLRGRSRFAVRQLPDEADGEGSAAEPTPEVDLEPAPTPVTTPLRSALAGGIGLALIVAVAWQLIWPSDGRSTAEVLEELAGHWLIPLLVAGLLLAGLRSGVRVYESMIAGAREGLELVVRIVPYLVVILVAVAMFRASGALDLLIGLLDPITSAVGFPAGALPMALLRPLSGSGAFAVMAEILAAEGPDSFVGLLASTLQGSTETTFYVLTVYCGAAGIREVRHALPACLIGDLAGAIGATAACHLFF